MIPFRSKTIVTALIVLLMLVTALLVKGCWAGGSKYNSVLVDISRLSITSVCASSVNGNKPLTNRHYGVLNLFDDGFNFINNINYTYWLTDAQTRHWIKLSFSKPVIIHSVLVETTGKHRPKEYALELSQITRNLKRIIKDYDSIPIKGFRTTYRLPEPVPNINQVVIIFPGPEMIEVSEIKVMGQAPDEIDLTRHKPLIALTDYEAQGPHIIEVQRTIRAENDMRMITIAESTYPPRTEVLEAVKTAHFKLDEVPQENKLWWYSEFDNVRIPYAITGEAIDYYVKLVQGYRRREWKSDIEPSSKFSYSASVEFKNSYEKDEKKFRHVYVVKMKLSMSARFASLAAISFTKERIVVLDRQGKILAIFGDGKTPTVVS